MKQITAFDTETKIMQRTPADKKNFNVRERFLKGLILFRRQSTKEPICYSTPAFAKEIRLLELSIPIVESNEVDGFIITAQEQ